MGSVEYTADKLIVYSHVITYGNSASQQLTELIRAEIETMWNEPLAVINFKKTNVPVIFRITASYSPTISPLEIYQNLDPRNNFFRIEEFAHGNISFVDGLGCNSGYFKLENLYAGSTTAAHEYGHTLGLDHPSYLDYRGKGTPGIMYPRGTLVDPQYQYNPAGNAGDSTNGGTMHPKYRKVLRDDIARLNLHKLEYREGKAIVGEFSNIWHPDHKTLAPGEFTEPGIMG